MPPAADRVPPGTPEDVRGQAEQPEARAPQFDPTLGIAVPHQPRRGTPPHRLVVLGDSLSHGFQSGAVYHTDVSWPAIVAHELGWLDEYRYPVYGGPGGLPLNIELLLRHLEERFGPRIGLWELPMALFAARSFMDGVEDYWERGPGRVPPKVDRYNHDLAIYGWDLRDALSRTAAMAEQAIERPNDSLLDQIVENDSARAALRVFPHWNAEVRRQTLLEAAAALGRDHDGTAECGIETLVVFLGANNALRSVVDLRVRWTEDDFRDLDRKGRYTVWRPEHFAAELAEVVRAVQAISARHTIWCTVPHVTIPPVTRGIGHKVRPGSRYFPYYARPWVRDDQFDPTRDRHLTEQHARAIDAAIDLYNADIERVVRNARTGSRRRPPRDWFLFDVAGLLDRLASRRYIADPNARPSWWTPYPLPSALAALDPPPDSRFLIGDGTGGRAAGGLFSLDGVHPTTVGYGVVAQEVVSILQLAGVPFHDPSGHPRVGPVLVDFDRLLRRDTLVNHPPQNLGATLDVLGWADENLGWVARALAWRPTPRH
ncbi:hypothetical protein [Geodermatophilus ruber]|uniref:GDSL-like Lipase/Acylhydrolase n=1 Tax=Geodermatophilus ruber TaxID=504800 RepID=A0A1I4AFM1_9ACTN|nr:hypothetical protein [Geodermatophilus ruber]SFK55083.1 hypothetical protein SAMN04488085_102212 [Geodermatophilus ruber]